MRGFGNVRAILLLSAITQVIMKHMEPVLAAFLMAACALQVHSGKNWQWMTPSSSSSCYNEGTELGVRIPPARLGGSWIEITPNRITFEKKNIYADDQDTGLRPNTEEMVDFFLEELSGLTPESLLQAMGSQEISQRNAIISMLAGLLLGQVEDKINAFTIALFLRMFDAEAAETSTALKIITNVIKEIKMATNNKNNASDYLLEPETMETYHEQSKSASPISKEGWIELGSLIDHVVEGKRDAAEKIVNFLASRDEEMQSLINKNHAEQVNIAETLTEDVVNFRTFLEYVKLARESED